MNEDWWRQWQSFAAQFGALPGMGAPARVAGSAGFGEFAEAAERFKTAAQSFIDGVSKTASPHSSMEAALRFGDALREQFADLILPWNVAAGSAQGTAAPTKMPALGLTREHQQRWQRMLEQWQRVEEAQRRLQRLWSDALREAAQTFAQRLQQMGAPANAAQAVPGLYDAWIDCAEEAYARMAHGEVFIEAQAQLINAGSQWRTELQVSIEHWAKLLDLPTRSELNSLSKRLRAVEQQLRSRADAKAVAASPKPAPVRRRKARP